jgi:hypothetical protein
MRSVCELERLQAVWKRSDAGPERNLYAARDRNPRALLAHRCQAVLSAGCLEALVINSNYSRVDGMMWINDSWYNSFQRSKRRAYLPLLARSQARKPRRDRFSSP